MVGRLRHLRVPDAFEPYLLRTVVNLHTSRLRHVRVERDFVAREQRSAPPEASAHDVGDRDVIWRALGRLPRRQRAAIALRYFEDLSERETADILRCSIAAVKALTARALETLRLELRGEDR